MEPKKDLSSAALDWCKEIGADSVKNVDDILLENNSKAYALCTRAIQNGIDRANEKATSNAQKVQKWTLLKTDFSVPGGELGPTLKLKRHFVLAKYGESIKNMYNV
jgi:long-chain-fatty-acid--CoA ligase ACSBG